MERLSKYIFYNNSISSSGLNNTPKEISSIDDITEQSSPFEISKFVSRKLVEFINTELELKKIPLNDESKELIKSH